MFGDYLIVFPAILGLVGAIWLIAWIVRSRCPSCGKFAAARVTSSREEVSVVTEEWGYDEQRQEYRNIPRRNTGYTITRTCRFCGHSWDRLESSERQIDRLTDEEAQRYRERNKLL